MFGVLQGIGAALADGWGGKTLAGALTGGKGIGEAAHEIGYALKDGWGGNTLGQALDNIYNQPAPMPMGAAGGNFGAGSDPVRNMPAYGGEKAQPSATAQSTDTEGGLEGAMKKKREQQIMDSLMADLDREMQRSQMGFKYGFGSYG